MASSQRSCSRSTKLSAPASIVRASGAIATRADHVGADGAGELHGDGPDGATGPVDHRGLPGGQLAMIEQGLPGREPGLGDGCGVHVIDRRRLRRHVAGLDGDELAAAPSR